MNKTLRFSCTFFVLLLSAYSLSANDEWRQKVDPELLATAESGRSLAFIVQLGDQADLSAAVQLPSKNAKGEYVYRQLIRHAEKTQGAIRQLLQNRNIPFRPLFLVNALATRGDLSLIRQLAERREVANIQPDPMVRFDEPIYRPLEGNARDLTWGLQKIAADLVWAMGYTGQGVIVGGQDTGVEWDHPAIRDQYRGWDGQQANHNYNWHDAIHEISPLHNDTIIEPSNNPCGLDVDVPCDDHSHGTHTVGTMVGDDGMGNQIGVAPSARWIAVRNMERGYGSPSTYIEGFQWFLAPTDLNNENPDPTKAPHVINNSWGCPEMEGCNASNFATMETAVNNLKAAGIVVVVSAGNSGSSCGSIDDPAAIFENSFSVGATRNNDTIAGFSSRGLVDIDGSMRLKPNISAPGVGVRSATRNGNYASWNGTSMAGPHVVGVVALMISANPGLAGQVELIETIIEETAAPAFSTQTCGGISPDTYPNPVVGYGRIDALAAVNRALELSTDTDNPLLDPQVKIFPNPSRTEVTFQPAPGAGRVQLQWYNSAGQLMGNDSWDASAGENKTLRLDNVPAGLYFYRLLVNGRTLTGKFIRESGR